MKKEELRQRFWELLLQTPPQKDIEALFQKAVDSGALDISNEPTGDYRLARIIWYAILLEMAEQCRPLHEDNRKEAENLRLFF